MLPRMDNPLKTFFGGFGSLGGGEHNSAVGIDIGSSAIKVVEIKSKKGRAVLETYGAISLGPYAGLDAGRVTNLPIDKIADALKEVVKQSGTDTNNAAFAIP